MAVTGRTSSFSESRFFELLTAATTPASQGELRRSISGEKYQRILTSGSGASLLPCDATMPRRNTPPRNNRTSPYRFNSATAAPPIAAETRSQSLHSILQSLQKTNSEIQLQIHKQSREASLKREEYRPSPMELMEEIQRGCELRAKKFASIGQYHQSPSQSLHHDLFGSTSPRASPPIVPDPSLKRMEVGVERLGQLVQSTKNQVETVLSQVRELSGEFLEYSPQLHHHPLIVQDPVDWREDVDEVSGQKLQVTAAHQVFEEMPQPTTQTFDDDSEVTKSQKPEVSPSFTAADEDSIHKAQELPLQVPQSYNLCKVLGVQHIQKNNELEIKFLLDDNGLETSLFFKENGPDEIIVFPNSEESSYFVVDTCNLEVNSIPMDVLHFSQVIRMDGEEKEKIGVG